MPVPTNLAALPTNLAGSSAKPGQQEAWVNKEGYQADFQDTTDCGIKSKVAAKQIAATDGPTKGFLGALKGELMNSMEESKQLENCMLSKGYAKINVDAGKMPPQKPSANATYGSTGYGQQPTAGYTLVPNAPPAPSYAPTPGYTMVPNAPASAPSYVPTPGYTMVPNAPVSAPSYGQVPGYTMVPNAAAPVQNYGQVPPGYTLVPNK